MIFNQIYLRNDHKRTAPYDGSAFRLIRWVPALLFLGACTTNSGIQSFAPKIPEMPTALASSEAHWPDADWLQAFGNLELDMLVAQAQSANPDITIALSRVAQAQGRARAAKSSLFPEITFNGNAERQNSDNAARVDALSGRMVASYEVDLWGRNRALSDGAKQTLAATTFEEQAVRLMIVSEVIERYASLMTARERRAIALSNIETARRMLDRIEAHSKLGLALSGDVAAQRALVAANEAEIPIFDQAEVESISALAILTGRAAQNFVIEGKRLDSMSAVAIPAPGLSSDLLSRRPDVAAAEAGLAAANADVAATRAAMLPRITLVGSGGVNSGTGPTQALYSLVAGLTAPLVNRGRLNGERDTAIGVRMEREGLYRKAVLSALSDVERTAKAITNLDRTITALEIQVVEADKALTAAEARYRAGVDDLIISLDAQRTSYAARDRLVHARGERFMATVALYRALGGGWARSPSLALK